MTKYPLIEAMGLQVVFVMQTEEVMKFEGVHAEQLEKALKAAQIWYGDKNLDSWTTSKVWADTTHTARLICIQPIKKKTKAEAAIELLEEMSKIEQYQNWYIMKARKILEMEE